MNATRRKSCEAIAGTFALLLVPGCGGGDPIEPAGASCGGSGASISLNHGHSLVIAAADLDSTVDRTYSIRGAADHDHIVAITVAQLRQLKAGGSVAAMASVSAAHSHVATVTCAS